MVGKRSNSFQWDDSDPLSDQLNEVLGAAAGSLVPQSPPNAEPNAPPLPRSRPWKLLLLGMSVVAVLGSVSGAALWLLTTPLPRLPTTLAHVNGYGAVALCPGSG